MAVFRSGSVDHPHFLLFVPASLAPLALTARYPLLAWRLSYLVALLAPLLPYHSRWDPAQIAVLAVVFVVAGLRHSRRVLWAMWVLMLLPVWLWTGPQLAKPAGLTLGLTILTVAADATSAWRRTRRALAAQAQRTAFEQERRALLEERARIARELHDVVAHHMSLIAVQAETAPYRLADVPEPVRAELSSLSASAREALVDMRKLLGVLRNNEPAERTPQPKLSDLPELVAVTRRAGVQVDLSMTDVDCPAGVGVCAYRIVQEALSNAGQHAPGAAVTVTVDRDADSLRLLVANGPATTTVPSPNGHRPGHGLAGMHERAVLQGGSLTAAPTPGGGFAVSATLPLSGARGRRSA
jgi:signal transduction histidine kinase